MIQVSDNSDVPTFEQVQKMTPAEARKEYNRIMNVRREKLDSLYGYGTFQKNMENIKPHRCARYMDDFFFGMSNHLDITPLGTWVKCTISSPGNEPPRKYPNSPHFYITDDLKAKMNEKE
ncbi:hypothetical protein BC833DRAFT_617971 [Globomyces pollinis-pini]|nr:hypothetical protein BC833DRAFT_617971 [Globomyces pollinis-pini]